MARKNTEPWEDRCVVKFVREVYTPTNSAGLRRSAIPMAREKAHAVRAGGGTVGVADAVHVGHGLAGLVKDLHLVADRDVAPLIRLSADRRQVQALQRIMP